MWNGLSTQYPAIVAYLLNPKFKSLKNERLVINHFTEKRTSCSSLIVFM